MNRLFQTLAFSLMLVATAGNTQTNLDEFPLLGGAPDPNDLFLMVDVDPVGGNSTKNVLFSNITTHNHTESQITDLDKYTQAVVDGLLAGKSDTAHTHVEANITDLGAYLETVTAADVDAEASTDGHVLTSDGAGNAAWEAVSGGGGSSTLDGLTDTTLTSPADGQVLTYDNATSKWINAASAGGGGAAGNATSHFLIEEITNTVAGEFDFDNIPQDYDYLIIEGSARGDASAVLDGFRVYFNSDLTDSNYHLQQNQGSNGSAGVAEFSIPDVGVVPAASSPANSYASISLMIKEYTGPGLKGVLAQVSSYIDTDNLASQSSSNISSVTDPITRIRIRTDNHPTDGLTGTLRLIGVKAVSIEDSETITVKQEVPVTLTAGEFDIDLTNYQDGDRLVIEGSVRSAAVANTDGLYIQFNGDTTAANYGFQHARGHATASTTTNGSAPEIGLVPGNNATSTFRGDFRMVVEDYTGSNHKRVTNTYSGTYTRGTNEWSGTTTVSSSITAALTSVKLLTDGGEDLSGTVYAYIEKQGVLPAIPRAEGKVELQTITNTTAGEFDFDLSALTVPDGLKRLIIKGQVRATVSANSIGMHLFFNSDLTASNYDSVYAFVSGGTAVNGRTDGPDISNTSAASAPSGAYSDQTIVVEGYDSANLKGAYSENSFRETSATLWRGNSAISHISMTAEITRLRLRSTDHPTNGLIGTLTLYGEY